MSSSNLYNSCFQLNTSDSIWSGKVFEKRIILALKSIFER